MSVVLLVSNNADTTPLRSVAIATEESFKTYWVPASLEIGLRFVPLFQTGMPIDREDGKIVVKELEQLKGYFLSKVQKRENIEILSLIISRIDLLKIELAKEIERSDHSLYIG